MTKKGDRRNKKDNSVSNKGSTMSGDDSQNSASKFKPYRHEKRTIQKKNSIKSNR